MCSIVVMFNPERIYLYYSEVSGEDANYNKTGGLACESEDIESTEVSLEEALGKIKSGEIMDAKTVIGIYWAENRQLKGNSEYEIKHEKR